jgi:predicted TIM-barrel fold metal-dependent hydrolase
MPSEPHRIDVHHHIVPREYVHALAGIGIETPGRFPFPDWSPEAALQRFYYDTALSATRYALPSLGELVDPTHILFGTDYPFAPEHMAGATISGLEDHGGFDAPARRAIERDNAARLFPRVVNA